METISLLPFTFEIVALPISSSDESPNVIGLSGVPLGSLEFDPAWSDGDCVDAAALALLPDVDISRRRLRGGCPSVVFIVRYEYK